jgi:hypothetical protein
MSLMEIIIEAEIRLIGAVVALVVSTATLKFAHRLGEDYRRLRRPQLASVIYAGMPKGSARYRRQTRWQAFRRAWKRHTE